MASSDADKWDKRYRETTSPNPVATVLRENSHLLPAEGLALELASGLGGNSFFLAEQGLDVTAFDISSVGLHQLEETARANQLPIQTTVVDLENWAPEPESFDVIVVTHFYLPNLFHKIQTALKSGGLVFYQTFTAFKVSDQGPSNPDFLLGENELIKRFSDLCLIAYREEKDLGDTRQGLRNLAYIVAQKP